MKERKELPVGTLVRIDGGMHVDIGKTCYVREKRAIVQLADLDGQRLRVQVIEGDNTCGMVGWISRRQVTHVIHVRKRCLAKKRSGK